MPRKQANRVHISGLQITWRLDSGGHITGDAPGLGRAGLDRKIQNPPEPLFVTVPSGIYAGT